MTTRRTAGIVASLALHAAALSLAVVALPRDPALGPLFVDLTVAGEGVAAAGATRSSPTSRHGDARVHPASRGRPAVGGRPTEDAPSTAPASARDGSLNGRATESSPSPVEHMPATAFATSSDSRATDAAHHPGIELMATPANGSNAEPSASPSPHGGDEATRGGGGGASRASASGTGEGSEGGTRAGGGPVDGGASGRAAGTGGAGQAGGGLHALASGGHDVPVEFGPYLAGLRRRIQEALEYPASARRRGLTGTVHVEVIILASGAVDRVSVVRSSSHAILDDAARAAVLRLAAAPLPAALPARALTVRLPVVFELR